ncbi:DNA-binding NtrC family response regulator [Granulicella aggregans]|uniref:DNA-binding NtrC family response regulator n=1 Tax=Granulicella aggregans TaxID=474949 RepID=A0A7W7ZHJ2_9BACT|nr:sigma 54-interacting transcriptional regulator [Granulicella aggregans]MBB5059993.1 DNA-binding NtrC family response regulator [Granulicella aggregans]
MSEQEHSVRASRAFARAPAAALRPYLEDLGLCALEDYICLTGDSFAMRSLRAQLRRVSPHFRVALVTGETGTCKETVALALHRVSADSDGTFSTHTASSLLELLPGVSAQVRATLRAFGGPPRFRIVASNGAPPTLQPIPFLPPPTTTQLPPRTEPELLPTFTGPGRTLFIRGVDELSAPQQVQLRQTLQRLSSARIGPERPRMIFSAGRDLRSLAGAGHFDRKLYRLISAVEILIPPLRSRLEDLPLITSAILGRCTTEGCHPTAAFDGRALAQLQAHDWPGNVRELERVVELARPHSADGDPDCPDGVIDAAHLPPLGEFDREEHSTQIEVRVERLDDVIHNHVLDVLLRCNGNKVRAADRLGISRSTLYRMLEAGAAPARKKA